MHDTIPVQPPWSRKESVSIDNSFSVLESTTDMDKGVNTENEFPEFVGHSPTSATEIK